MNGVVLVGEREVCGVLPGGRREVETTELRWFADGALPPAVWMWFTHDGANGEVEQRRDLYRMDGCVDVGVKLRARSTLELKVRRSVSSTTRSSVVPGGVTLPSGVIEVWQKWGPADELIGSGPEPRLELHKTVVKRRFTSAGEEIAVHDHTDPKGGGFCDVEIVAIAGAAEAWSFAFAAQGPRRSRRASIDAAWRTLVSAPPPATWPEAFAASCGYPEWLARGIGVGSPMAQR